MQQQAVNVLLFNFQVIMFQIAYGYKGGVCTMVGQQVGAGNTAGARRYFRVIMTFCFLFDVFEFAFLFAVRHYIIMIFTR